MTYRLENQKFGHLTALRRDGKLGAYIAWLCRCECGAELRVASYCLRAGRVKSCGCLPRVPHNKGVSTSTRRHFGQDGYARIRKPGHPNAWSNGIILEHVFIMSELLGRPLEPHENVHHKNGDRTDNCPENLELWSKVQPAGQRVKDKVIWARKILALYGDIFPEGVEDNF